MDGGLKWRYHPATYSHRHVSATGVMDFENRDFTLLVKRTREKLNMSLDEAHDVIFADAGMRRLVAWRINHDAECRKQALWDIRHRGEQSRFVRDGDHIAFREPRVKV